MCVFMMELPLKLKGKKKNQIFKLPKNSCIIIKDLNILIVELGIQTELDVPWWVEENSGKAF